MGKRVVGRQLSVDVWVAMDRHSKSNTLSLCLVNDPSYGVISEEIMRPQSARCPYNRTPVEWHRARLIVPLTAPNLADAKRGDRPAALVVRGGRAIEED